MSTTCVFCNGTKVEPSHTDCVWCDNTGILATGSRLEAVHQLGDRAVEVVTDPAKLTEMLSASINLNHRLLVKIDALQERLNKADEENGRLEQILRHHSEIDRIRGESASPRVGMHVGAHRELSQKS